MYINAVFVNVQYYTFSFVYFFYYYLFIDWSEEFTPQVLACVPAADSWRITDADLRARRDFRAECVFSIDPPTYVCP